MASRIKGITVEIGGDTTGLDKALKSANSSIKTTQSGLKDAQVRVLMISEQETVQFFDIVNDKHLSYFDIDGRKYLEYEKM